MKSIHVLTASILLASAWGCSGDAKVVQLLEEQKATIEKQQQTIAELSKAVKAIESRTPATPDDLSQVKMASDHFRSELTETKARISEVAQKVEHEVRRPTITVESPEITIQPAAPTTSAPRKKSVDLIIESVSVYGTKDNGGVWDESGPPDLKVRVETSSDSFTTATKQDTESASYDVKSIRVSEGDTLKITVIDGDVFSDDNIGSYSKLITADTLSQGGVKWSFGRVGSLALRFEP